jgi:hypothetical protein
MRRRDGTLPFARRGHRACSTPRCRARSSAGILRCLACVRMMRRWGSAHVSSALEVYFLLRTPPTDGDLRGCWRELLAIEPPCWGTVETHRRAEGLKARGLRVWTWDDYAVVVSLAAVMPPAALHYRSWHLLDLDEAQGSAPVSTAP